MELEIREEKLKAELKRAASLYQLRILYEDAREIQDEFIHYRDYKEALNLNNIAYEACYKAWRISNGKPKELERKILESIKKDATKFIYPYYPKLNKQSEEI